MDLYESFVHFNYKYVNPKGFIRFVEIFEIISTINFK